jgi:hypothetical protein
VDDDTAAALRDLVALADALPGQFRPEFDLGYWFGVTGQSLGTWAVGATLRAPSSRFSASPLRKRFARQRRKRYVCGLRAKGRR